MEKSKTQNKLLRLPIQFFAKEGMTVKERELRQALAEKRDKIMALNDEGKVDEAKTMLAEAQVLKEQIQNYEEMRNMYVDYGDEDQQDDQGVKSQVVSNDVSGKQVLNHTELFADAIMKGKAPKPLAAMKESVDEDGGLIVPEDITTKINQRRRQFDTLANLVEVIPVTTNKGARTLEKNADMTPLIDVDELEFIDEMENPKFERIKYDIKNRAGILVLSNDLLNDTREALLQFLVNWLGKKSAVTRNVNILKVLNELSRKAISTTDDIKDITNVDLDPAINETSVFVTNQSGFNYLDKLKDKNGNYLLQPDPINKTKKMLFDKTVHVISNKFLPNSGTKTKPKYPLIIGDMFEAVKLFDRQRYSIRSTEEGKAFYRISTDLRVIQRDDVVLWDEEAIVFAEFTGIEVIDEKPPETDEDKAVDAGK
ncbi:phage major capsid protein [Bacillus altitudinis]|uniref:phage major capsid protein n=1 Tax=Bacillus altitudinis TaxID=293387 RepID=UPI00227E7FC8|nr:phage major capsid protein [Bacillus altitudinis]MCY7439187.1 phage major capsid protein [Bacillus altitudinis]MEC1142292.1 phage major capsid protein [Bacillus altitudinis]